MTLVRIWKFTQQYYEILKAIVNRKDTISKLHEIGHSRQYRDKAIKILYRKGYIDIKKVGRYSFFSLTPFGLKELVNYQPSNSPQKVDNQHISIHDLSVSARVFISPPLDKVYRTEKSTKIPNMLLPYTEKFLKLEEIPFKSSIPKGWKDVYFNFTKTMDLTVRVTPDRIRILFPRFVFQSLDSELVKNDLWKNIQIGVKEVEDFFNREFKRTGVPWRVEMIKPDRINFKVDSQHIALVNNPIAKWFHEKGYNLDIRSDIDNKSRVIVDFSDSQNHLEFIHPATAEEDCAKIVRFFSSIGWDKVPNLIKSLKDDPESVKELLTQIIDNDFDKLMDIVKEIRSVGNPEENISPVIVKTGKRFKKHRVVHRRYINGLEIWLLKKYLPDKFGVDGDLVDWEARIDKKLDYSQNKRLIEDYLIEIGGSRPIEYEEDEMKYLEKLQDEMLEGGEHDVRQSQSLETDEKAWCNRVTV